MAAGLGRGAEDGRDQADTGLARGPELVLAGDQAVAVGIGVLDDDGVEKPVQADGGCQGGQGFGVEVMPGLLGVGTDPQGVDLDEDRAAAHVPAGIAAGQEGVEAAAEAMTPRGRHAGLGAEGAVRGHASEGTGVDQPASAWRRASRLAVSSR